ncbi:DUF4278 domain-containing protein [Laspinema sp. A4]|uniref:DUF4278 domain-containing protein n=1 Tax=Laspinema sp. D2d TaxID=2953686 RepID=UPI0021BB3514|nr:DUF4278 domain-containing protein [Laspinema sp. D2d]MCT7983486.1 DUF4278 domain-containing protein [Laspinema sp. D2d]
MHLSYRGISYQTSTAASVPATQSPLQAKYRGLSYSLHSESEISAPPAVTLQYRGVSYSLDPAVGQPQNALESMPLQPALV